MTSTNTTEAISINSMSLSQALAHLASVSSPKTLPPETFDKAQLHLLDTLGLALASHAEDFAKPSLDGIAAAGCGGDCAVLGTSMRLSARDAALANGLLMHGLDFDDTHLASIIHASVASLPTALALGEKADASWDEMLCAYILGMEAAIRIGASVKGGFHHVGFHATGVVSHFSSAIVAGKLLGLDAAQIAAAQGIAASTASGVQAFLEEGAWTKRMHPGWGALSGISAAYMARSGFAAPTRPYEGKFGLYDTHLHGTVPDAGMIRDKLGEQWRMLETAIKPYPICHFNHGCAEAAIILHEQLVGRIDDIAEVTAWLAEPTMHIVAEPAEAKQNVTTDYEAKFSAQYAVAVCLLKGRFGLGELSAESLRNEQAKMLTKKVICRVDTNSLFPQSFSGGVSVAMKDGTTLENHVSVNKGAGNRAMSADDIAAKFMANAQLKVSRSQADSMMNAVMEGRASSVREVMKAFVL